MTGISSFIFFVSYSVLLAVTIFFFNMGSVYMKAPSFNQWLLGVFIPVLNMESLVTLFNRQPLKKTKLEIVIKVLT